MDLALDWLGLCLMVHPDEEEGPRKISQLECEGKKGGRARLWSGFPSSPGQLAPPLSCLRVNSRV